MPLKWGIAGAGKISNDFSISLRNLPTEDHQAYAVGARVLDRAQIFAEKHHMKKAYGSYEELAKDPDVEVVYVGVISPYHFFVSKLMLENGKHVLCEKPLTMNSKEATELNLLAKEKNLFLMQAIWSRCFPLYRKLNEALQNKVIGDIKYVHCTFGSAVKRVISKETGNGSLLDIGIYGVQFITLAFGQEIPSKVVAVGHLNNNDVDKAICASFQFPNGGVASLTTSTEIKYPCEGVIYGTKGTIKMHYPFWCPTKLTINSEEFEVNIPENTTSDSTMGRNSSGMQYQAEEVRQCLLKGLKESPVITNSESKLILTIMDQIRSEVGIVYPADNQ
ncbi:Trans-1,2-dihydrobenzene-1,2-diol dehydrogenase [Nymphon striatum]|nr:Trans-1,2-dihydrobenzene-1,2-diol dehydrogenase [Nymphon striatum]